VEVYLAMWTSRTAAGSPCTKSEAASCKRMLRQLTVVVGAGGDELWATVTPDSSVDHYLFIVKVRSSTRGGGVPPVCALLMRQDAPHAVAGGRRWRLRPVAYALRYAVHRRLLCPQVLPERHSAAHPAASQWLPAHPPSVRASS
jgi:hypothetical protein